jgi:hypothetical protein
MSNASAAAVERRTALIVAVLGEAVKPIAPELASDDPSRVAAVKPDGNVTQTMLDRAKLVNQLSKMFDDDKVVTEIATDLTVSTVRDVALHYDKERLAKIDAPVIPLPHTELIVGDKGLGRRWTQGIWIAPPKIVPCPAIGSHPGNVPTRSDPD